MTDNQKYEEAAKAFASTIIGIPAEEILPDDTIVHGFLAGASFAEKDNQIELSKYAYEADRAKIDRDLAEAREKHATEIYQKDIQEFRDELNLLKEQQKSVIKSGEKIHNDAIQSTIDYVLNDTDNVYDAADLIEQLEKLKI